MVRHKHESVEGWEQDARDYAKAERELGIERWVCVSIGYRNDNGETITLYGYDLPREILERYRWVIRWRTAKLQCLHPRRHMTAWHSYYDKRSGLKTDFNSCLGRLAAARAQITKAERSIERYIVDQKSRYPMFYDESADPELIKYRQKLAQKIGNCRRAEERLRLMVGNRERTGIFAIKWSGN